MWTKILEVVISQVVLPLIKDLVFMIVNFLKVRKMRKESEESAKKKADEFKKAQTEQDIKDTFENLP